MLLALDIGNSHIKFAGFNKDDLCFVASIATDSKQTSEQYAYTIKNVFELHNVSVNQINSAILCSVVPSMIPIINKAISFICKCQVLTVSSGIKTGLNIKLEQAKTLGSDFVANAVYAVHKKELPCVVVDLGTATTFTVIDENGVLIGKSIASGVGIMLEGLKHNAAQLPTVQLEQVKQSVIGKNTSDAICSGIVHGTAAMIDGMIERFAKELEQTPNVLITGGASSLVYPYINTKAQIDTNATLYGLLYIWQKNCL